MYRAHALAWGRYAANGTGGEQFRSALRPLPRPFLCVAPRTILSFFNLCCRSRGEIDSMFRSSLVFAGLKRVMGGSAIGGRKPPGAVYEVSIWDGVGTTRDRPSSPGGERCEKNGRGRP